MRDKWVTGGLLACYALALVIAAITFAPAMQRGVRRVDQLIDDVHALASPPAQVMPCGK